MYRPRLGLWRLVGEELCERLMSLVVCKGMLDMLDVMCYCCAHEHGVLKRWWAAARALVHVRSCLCQGRWMSRFLFGSVCLMQRQTFGPRTYSSWLDPLSLMWQYLILVNTDRSELKLIIRINFYHIRVNSDLTTINSDRNKINCINAIIEVQREDEVMGTTEERNSSTEFIQGDKDLEEMLSEIEKNI